MFISLIIPTCNRINDLKNSLESVFAQNRLPDEVIIVNADNKLDINNIADSFHELITIIDSEKGLTIQRNLGLKNISGESDIVLFIDDDIVLEEDFIEKILKCYEEDKDELIGGVEGYPYVDGKKKRRLKKGKVYENRKSLYGCNMSFRVSSIEGELFDENMHTHAWLEDLDFSLRIGKKHILLRVNNALCRHNYSQVSRISEKVYGYRQLAYWFYVKEKTGVPLSVTVSALIHPIKNMLRIISTRYRERLKGNLIAIYCIVKYYKNPIMLLERDIEVP